MVEWFQRNNDKNHITNKVNGRKRTRLLKKIMKKHKNSKSKRKDKALSFEASSTKAHDTK